MTRHCGACSLCCRVLPIKELGKAANTRCEHQRLTGCKIYHTAQMPFSCRAWTCRWLSRDDTNDLRRPDFSHYVLDVMPDFITVRDNDTGETHDIQVIQVWCDPKHPDAHRDPPLRAYLERRAAEGIAAIVRYSAQEAFVLWGPAFTGGGFVEQHTACRTETHTAGQIAAALGPDYVAVNMLTGEVVEEEAHGQG